MVGYRDYKALATVAPAAAISSVSKPWDFMEAQRQIAAWETALGQRGANELRDMQIEEEREKQEKQDAYEEEYRKRVEEGSDPLKIKESEIAKKVNDWDRYLKASTQENKAEELANQKKIRDLKDIYSLEKMAPGAGQTLANEMNYGILRAPAPKASGSTPAKEKPAKPQTWVNVATGERENVDANSVEETRSASKRGYVPAKEVDAMTLALLEDKKNSAPKPNEQTGKGITQKASDLMEYIYQSSRGALPQQKKKVYAVQR
jgi:hypothetical protein